MRSWYHMSDSAQAEGPFTEREVKLRQKEGRISHDTLVWREGLENWLPFFESELNSQATMAPLENTTMSHELAPAYIPKPAFYSGNTLGGRGRAWVWAGPVIASIAAFTVFAAGIKLIEPELIADQGEVGLAGWALVTTSFLLFFTIPIFLRLARLKNLGIRPWWILLELVPVVNIGLWWLCFCCPEGFAEHRKLDWLGWLLSAVFFTGLFVSFVLLWFWTTPV